MVFSFFFPLSAELIHELFMSVYLPQETTFFQEFLMETIYIYADNVIN